MEDSEAAKIRSDIEHLVESSEERSSGIWNMEFGQPPEREESSDSLLSPESFPMFRKNMTPKEYSMDKLNEKVDILIAMVGEIHQKVRVPSFGGNLPVSPAQPEIRHTRSLSRQDPEFQSDLVEEDLREVTLSRVQNDIKTLTAVTQLLRSTMEADSLEQQEKITKLQRNMAEVSPANHSQVMDAIFRIRTDLDSLRQKVDILIKSNDYHHKTREMLFWFHAKAKVDIPVYRSMKDQTVLKTIKSGERILICYPQQADSQRNIWMTLREVDKNLTASISYVKVYDGEQLTVEVE